MNCPKCGSSRTSSFLKSGSDDMVQFQECDDCGFEWSKSDNLEDKVCCMCNEKKKFLGRFNAGKKYYCIQCSTKITKSDLNYWKPCSMVEFFENMSSNMKKGNGRKSNMFSSLKKTLREIKESESSKEYDDTC